MGGMVERHVLQLLLPPYRWWKGEKSSLELENILLQVELGGLTSLGYSVSCCPVSPKVEDVEGLSGDIWFLIVGTTGSSATLISDVNWPSFGSLLLCLTYSSSQQLFRRGHMTYREDRRNCFRFKEGVRCNHKVDLNNSSSPYFTLISIMINSKHTGKC